MTADMFTMELIRLAFAGDEVTKLSPQKPPIDKPVRFRWVGSIRYLAKQESNMISNSQGCGYKAGGCNEIIIGLMKTPLTLKESRLYPKEIKRAGP